MIPEIKSFAESGYSAETSFHYSYDGYQYGFIFDGSLDTVSGYYFQSDALNAVIDKTAEYYNVSITSILGNKINFLLSAVTSSMYNTLRNWIISANTIVADWAVSDTSIYAWRFESTGIDPNYPGNETYGAAYGWRFTGAVGDKTDIVLDQSGHLYGSTPIGNVTGSEDVEDFAQWSIHQFDGDDIWYQPSLPSNLSFNDLDAPYIEGSSLYWKIYRANGSAGWFRVDNFVDTYISVNYNSYAQFPVFYFWSPSAVDATYSDITNIDGGYYREKGHIGNGGKSNVLYISFYSDNPWNDAYNVTGFNLPNNYRSANGSIWNTSSTVNCKGRFNGQYIEQSTRYIYLAALTTTPVPDMPSIPIDEPVPFSDLDPDPTEYEPSDDPEPVPGIDYPVPEPTPVPLPPIPSIVSGNDDLWPDLNGLFDGQANLDQYLSPLSNFSFSSFATLTESFGSAMAWVSTCMMTIYNGSSFSVLFSVLAMLFIACALLGIYKWWTH